MATQKKNPTIKAKTIHLSNLLYTGKFHVPWHQRYYDWEKENVKELLHDLDEALAENRNCYFLGAIMLIKKGSRTWEINDGQQRMMTFSLICAALCRLFENKSDSRREGLALRVLFDLDQDHTNTLSEAKDLEPRLKPPRNDSRNYTLLIHNDSVGERNGKLLPAWQMIENFFSDMSGKKAQCFLDFMLHKIEVAALDVSHGEDPNMIFETLNFRGKQLSELDLLRNHLYSFFNKASEPSRETIHRSLEKMIEALKTKTADYASCYFQCQFGHLPKKQFYQKVKHSIKEKMKKDRKIRTEKGKIDFAHDLVSGFTRDDRIETFRTMLKPDREADLIAQFAKDSGKNVAKPGNLFTFMNQLKSYKAAQPIIFALLEHYINEHDGQRKKDLARAINGKMKMLTSFIMRTTLVLPKFEPSHYDKNFSKLAQEITCAESLDAIPFESRFRELDRDNNIMNDAAFIKKTTQVRISDAAKAKRLLLALTDSRSPRSSSIINERQCTVEHILPQSEKHLEGWEKFTADTHKTYVDMLGNLTLLGAGETTPGDKENQSFTRKKKIFKDSPFSITKEVANIKKWSPAAIQRRQKRLATLAAKAWAFPKQ